MLEHALSGRYVDRHRVLWTIIDAFVGALVVGTRLWISAHWKLQYWYIMTFHSLS